jgi:type IV pilus assembly protein PilW
VTPRTNPGALRAQRGFTLVELLIVMIIGAVVVGASLQLLDRTRTSSRTEALRVDLQQNARYAMDMLTRELQQGGQSLDATPTFGPLAVVDGASGKPDTLYVLFAEPDTPIHTLAAPTSGKIKIVITCGDPVSDIKAGSMLYIASGSQRGVIRILTATKTSNGKTCKTTPGTVIGSLDLTYTVIDGQRHGWIFQGNLAGAAAMRANAAVYYIDGSNAANPRLMRATDYVNGAWVGVPMADNISDLQVNLVFSNSITAAVANGTDADAENDYDDINTVQVDLRAVARRTDKDLNKGQLYGRNYRLAVTPRNQIYTRNLE